MLIDDKLVHPLNVFDGRLDTLVHSTDVRFVQF